MTMPSAADARRPPGLFHSLGQLARTLIGIARTRLELVANELEEERIRFTQLALLVAGIVFCLQMAVLLAVVLVVVVFWNSHPLLALGAFTALFLIGGIAGIVVLRHQLRTRPKMFAATIGEFVKDEHRLGED
jgi:uncharacterized membrane protein YqjE